MTGSASALLNGKLDTYPENIEIASQPSNLSKPVLDTTYAMTAYVSMHVHVWVMR